MKKTNIIKVDGKAYQKTLQWGNRNLRVAHRNRKAYDRNRLKREELN